MEKRERIWTGLLAVGLVALAPLCLHLLWKPEAELPETEAVETAPAPQPVREESPPVEAAPPAPRTPQEVLAAQVIDENHDAFLVHTRGKMGTLLVTVECVGRNNDEAGSRQIEFSIWKPDNLEEPMQRFSSNTLNFGVHEVADLNFDGFEEFGYRYSWGTGRINWDYWLWDEGQGAFVKAEALARLSSPVPHPEKKLLTSYERFGPRGDGKTSWYRWEGSELAWLRDVILSEVTFGGDGHRITVVVPVNGHSVEIHQEILYEDTMWEEERKWNDVDYFGEPDDPCRELVEQTLDETHDAFLVNTGGELGTLLVTTEMNTHTFVDDLLRISVWDPADMQEPLQVLEEHTDGYRDITIQDVNFDGYPDLSFCNYHGGHSWTIRFLVWSETKGLYVTDPTYQVKRLQLDPENQVIRGYGRGGAFFEEWSFYRWYGEELICARRITMNIKYPETGAVYLYISVSDSIGGTMQEVFYREFAMIRTPEYDRAPEECEQVMEKWSNLDYHGDT